jgi:hypothetical protein
MVTGVRRIGATSDSDPTNRRRSHVRRGGTSPRDRGAALIEAAILTPVFFLLILGLMEGAWIIFGDMTARSSASAGVRTASALANDAAADFRALESAKKGIDTIGRANLIRVVVYKANGYGDPPSAACRAGTQVTGVCNVYDGADLSRPLGDFGCAGTSPDRFWCPTARKTAVTGTGGPPDYIGVWVYARHQSLSTAVFNAERYASAHQVLRVEPRTVE